MTVGPDNPRDITRIASNAKTQTEIDDMSEFVALFYAKSFRREARKDLEGLSEMIAYEEHSPTAASKCLKSMGNHTWYLHQSLIPLCLLDPEVPVELKEQISEDILNMQDYDESTHHR